MGRAAATAVTRSWPPILLAIAACHAGTPAPEPESLRPIAFDRADWRPLAGYLDSAMARGAAPGAVLGVSREGRRFFHSTGQLGADDHQPTGPASIYDLASLTKVVGLTSAVMLAVSDGRVALDAPVERYVPAFAGPGKSAVSVRMLLNHVGGLPAWRPIFREVTSRAAAFALVDSTPLEAVPRTRDRYSDLGAMVLTQVVEGAFGERLDSLLERRLFGPLGMTSTRYLPPPEWLDRIAPTELDPGRGRVLRGEVHDENAAILDGVSGHAGLFGSAEDLLTFAEWLLERTERVAAEQRDGHPSLRPGIAREFTRRQNLVPGSSRALGWDTPAEGSSAGHLLSAASFGHTGFTGTSLWIDPIRHLAIVLLSNRVNPTRDNPRWNPVRARVADLVMTTLFEDAR
jgi:serine-type D-Ala-D-Ala carboxypeptidase